jgi:branched-chain amino acid transport system ATP-binding protein
MTRSALSAEALHVGIGTIEVLHGVSIEVAEGSIVTVIGANGAGKTTLMRTLAGQLAPRSGTIRYGGQEKAGLRDFELARWGLAMVPEGRHLFPNLTVRENLLMGAIRIRDRREIDRRIERVTALFPRLDERMWQPGSSLSGGEQQMLAIGRALMSEPKILLLDEPSLGLAPNLVKQIFATIGTLTRTGLTVLLVEQNARMALRLADHAYVLRLGRIVKHDSGAALLDDDEVTNAYLGNGTGRGFARSSPDRLTRSSPGHNVNAR